MAKLTGLLALLISLTISEGGLAAEKTRVREVRQILKKLQLSPADTCLDEYLEKRSRIIRQMSFGAAGGAGLIGASSAVAASGIATTTSTTATAGAAATTSTLWPFVTIAPGLTTIGTVLGGALIVYEGVQTARLVSNGRRIKELYETREGKGQHFERMYRQFERKYGADFVGLNKEVFSQAVRRADAQGAFCLNPKRPLRRKKIQETVNKYLQNQAEDKNKCGTQSVLYTGSASAIVHKTSIEAKGWSYLLGATEFEIKAQVNNNGMRPVDIEPFGHKRYNATFVKNAGENKVDGHWWMVGSLSKILKDVKNKNARIIDLDLVTSPLIGKDTYSAVYIKNTGNHAKDWALISKKSLEDIKKKYDQCDGRMVDFIRHSNGKYTAIIVKKKGVDDRPWWILLNRTSDEINSFNSNNGTKLYQLSRRSDSRFDALTEKQTPGRWRYRIGINSNDLSNLIGQEKTRIIDLNSRVKNGTRVYDAITLRATNSLEENLITTYRGQILPNNPNSYFGFYLKEVDGPRLASTLATRRFYPASSIKVIHKYALSRMFVQGLVSSTDQINHCGAADATLTPTMRSSNGTANATGSCPFSFNGCPTNSQNQFNVQTVAGLMMVNSSNRATQSIRELVGDNRLQLTINQLNMNNTMINHRVGCMTNICTDSGQEQFCGANDNQVVDIGANMDLDTTTYTTLQDLSSIWAAAVGPALLATPAGETINGRNFFDANMNTTNGVFNVTNMINNLNATVSLSSADLSDFLSRTRNRLKPGSTNSGGFNYRSYLGYLQLPYKVGSEVELRYFVYGVYTHAADTNNSAAVQTSLQQMLVDLTNDKVNEAMNSWK